MTSFDDGIDVDPMGIADIGLETADINLEMDKNRKKTPISNASNVALMFTQHRDWKGVLGYDTFSETIMLQQPIVGGHERAEDFIPRPLEDNDATVATIWFNNNRMRSSGKQLVFDGMIAEAFRHAYSPLEDHLNAMADQAEVQGLPVEFLSNWAIRTFRIEPEDDEHLRYLQAVSRAWIISMVARGLKAGCKADCMIVLEGSQGLYKSTALRILCGNDDWFSDSPPPKLDDDKAADHGRGRWLIEFQEMLPFRRDIETAKSWLSTAIDIFRPAYGRFKIHSRRQFVCAGSTNKDRYMIDETGNRRFWPLPCNEADIEWLKDHRDNIIGAAVLAYRAGENWWLDEETDLLARFEQDKRQPVDDWLGIIGAWLDDTNADETSVTHALSGALHITADKSRGVSSRHCVSCLLKLGWTPDGKFWTGEQRGRVKYVRPK